MIFEFIMIDLIEICCSKKKGFRFDSVILRYGLISVRFWRFSFSSVNFRLEQTEPKRSEQLSSLVFCSKAGSRRPVSLTLSVYSSTLYLFICVMGFIIRGFSLLLFHSISPSINSFTSLSPLKMCPATFSF